MVEDLDYTSFPNAARLEVLHSILPGNIDCLNLGYWVADLATLGHLVLVLQKIHLVTYQNLYWDLAAPLALIDPLLDPLESGSLAHVE